MSYISVTSGGQNHEIDVLLVESALLHKAPPGMAEQCVFTENVPKFYLFEKENKQDDSIYISSETPGYLTLISMLLDRGISLEYNETKADYVVQPTDSNNKYHARVSLDDSAFYFLANAKMAYHLFSRRRNNLQKQICPKELDNTSVLFIAIVVYMTLVIIYYAHTYKINYKASKKILFWVFNEKLNIIYGPPLESVDRPTSRLIKESAEQSKSTKNLNTNVIRLRRNRESHTYYRVATYPMKNGLFLSCSWKEDLPPSSDLTKRFRCEFHAKDHKVIEPPKIQFSSFRHYNPLNVSFTLDNSVEYVAPLPETLMAPYQPYGSMMTVIISLFEDLAQIVNTNPYIHSNFGFLAYKCCSKIGARRAFYFLNDGSLLYQYVGEGCTEIPLEDALKIPSKFNLVGDMMCVDELIETDLRCFINKVNGLWFSITTIIALDKKNQNDFFESFGLPFFSMCSIFIYQLSYAKEQNLRFDRFITIFSKKSDLFTFFEIGYPSKTVFIVRSNFLRNKTKTYIELINQFEEQKVNEITEIMEEVFKKVSTGEMVKQKAYELKNLDNKWISVTAVTNFEESINENIITVLVEDISEIKANEFDQIDTVQTLHEAYDVLMLQRFIIKDGDAYITNDNLCIELERNHETKLSSFVYPEDRIFFERMINGGKATFRLVHSSGQPKWYTSVCDGREGYLFCIQEIAEVRNRLLNNYENFNLSMSTDIVFWTINANNGLVRSILSQPTIWDTLSVDAEMRFSRFVDFIRNEDRDLFLTNYTAIIKGNKDHWDGELRILKVGETYEWHRLVMIRTHTDNLIHCLAMNIHQQKEMEIQLTETKKLRDLLLSSGKLALWRFINDRNEMEMMKKFDPGLMNLVSMNWTFVDKQIHPDYRELFVEKMRRAFEHDEQIEIDLPLILDDEIWVSLRGKLRSSLKQVVGVCIDITELRNAYNELEKEKKIAEEANKKKTVFLASMSHEIRTPMNGIFGMLDVLALQTLTGEQRLLVDSIRSSSFQLMKLLDDTLNLSKIEQGEIESNPTIFDLPKLFEPICIATASRARLNNVQLNVFITKNFPTLLYGDSQLFFQVLNNLLSNALKFTKDGTITIRLSWVEVNGSEFCILEVSDSGIGITKEQQRIIFERFSQADASVARFYGGTGLGLSLVQEIVRFLGGSVSVESELGHGTKFIVEVPFESIYVPYSPPFSDRKRHIVMFSVVDDLLKENLIEWIGYHKYEVISFSTIDEIEAPENSTIDAIFVEGNRDIWPKIAQKVSKFGKKQPSIVSLCEAGEPSYFKYTLAKPVQMSHLITLLNSFRYEHVTAVATTNLLSAEDSLRRILVVEDNKANQFVMMKILESIGCTYKIAENGKEAISTLDTDDFDLVFMDCQMPVMDGLEATKAIRRSGKLYASIPVIALTASAVEGDEQMCREAGMDGYLAKPVRIQQITDVLKQFSNHLNV